MIEYPWDYIFAFIGAIGSAATAFALFILWRQSNQTEKQIRLTQDQVILTQQEVEGTLRPWLAITNIKKNSDYKIEFDIDNHGRVSAKVVKSQYVFSATQITKEQVRGKDRSHYFMIFPATGKRLILEDQISINTPYVGILVNYEYATNKKGEFGLIAKYDQTKNEFIHLEEFAN